MNHGSSTWSIATILAMVGNRELRLQPDFQRFYIWDLKKEQLFIDSIMRNYPIPPIWVWLNTDADGRRTFEVVDGQQRLTCIKRFIDNRFPYRYQASGNADQILERANNSHFDRVPAGNDGQHLARELQNRFRDFQLSYTWIETNERPLIIDIFKRINKSSMNLTPQELRNAFFDGKFKQFVYSETARLQDDKYWGKSGRVFEKNTTDRMSDQQFLSDLVVALVEQEPQHQSEKLDEYYQRYDSAFNEQASIKKRVTAAMKMVKVCFPEPSRFTTNLSDFYTVFLLADEFLRDPKIKMDTGNIDILRSALHKFETDYATFLDGRGSARTDISVFEEYRETIVGRQREREVRQRRRDLLRSLIEPTLQKRNRDPLRLFTSEQRLYIWQVSKDKVCGICHQSVGDYDSYEPDHIVSWASGGRTTISNGQVSHRDCNSRRGERPLKGVAGQPRTKGHATRPR